MRNPFRDSIEIIHVSDLGIDYALGLLFEVIPISIAYFIESAYSYRFYNKQHRGLLSRGLGYFPRSLGEGMGYLLSKILSIPKQLGHCIDWVFGFHGLFAKWLDYLPAVIEYIVCICLALPVVIVDAIVTLLVDMINGVREIYLMSLLRKAVNSENLNAVRNLLRFDMVRIHLVVENPEILRLADNHSNKSTLHELLRCTPIYASFEGNQEFSSQLEAFTIEHVNELLFQVALEPDVIFSSSQSQLHYFMLRHLIRKHSGLAEVDRRSNLVAIQSFQSLAGVKELVQANHSNEYPADFFWDCEITPPRDELLIMARALRQDQNNAEIIRSIQAMCRTESHPDLGNSPDIFNNRPASSPPPIVPVQVDNSLELDENHSESAYRELNPRELAILGPLKAHYEGNLRRAGNDGAVFAQFKEHLKQAYLHDDNLKLRTVTFSTGIYATQRRVVLPFEWGEYQALLTRGHYTATERQQLSEYYYQNIYHTAHRYCSDSNPWKATTSAWPQMTLRHSHRPLLEYLWLAAQDPTQPPEEEGATVEGRIELFIRQIALMGRAHNNDNSRPILLHDGTQRIRRGEVETEEYDDLLPDRCTCDRGAGPRLFQGLIDHPLYKPVDKGRVEQLTYELISAYFDNKFSKMNCADLKTLQADLEAYFIEPGAYPESFNLANMSTEELSTLEGTVLGQLGEAALSYWLDITKRIQIVEGNVFVEALSRAHLQDKLATVILAKEAESTPAGPSSPHM